MSLTSHVIIRQAYARIGAFSGTAAQIATAYIGSLAALNTESFPLQSMYDGLTGIEGEIATAVGMNEDNPLRANISATVNIASGDVIPAAVGSAKIIGVLGQVRDAVEPYTLLTPALHEDEIRAILQNPNGLFKTSYFSYALRLPRFFATVPNAIMDVCVFDDDARLSAISANGELLFPMCQNAYLDGLMSILKNEDPALTALSSQFEGPYREWLASQQVQRPVTMESAA